MDSSELQGVLELVNKVGRERIAPIAGECDENARFPDEIWDLFKDLGLFALPFAKEYNGFGGSCFEMVRVTEELSKYDLTAPMLIVTQELAALPIVLAGSDKIKRLYLPEIAAGNLHGSFAMTEPDAGSDITSMRTKAVKDGDSYVINGTKCFISYADKADVICLFAKTNPAETARGISAFLIDLGKIGNGITVGKKENKMGIRGSSACEVIIEDCRVPAECLLGQENKAFFTVMQILDLTRPLIGACAVGLASGAMEVAMEYARQRVQFGKPITSFQGIRFLIAEQLTRIEAARQLVYESARRVDANCREMSKYSAMAKLFATDVAMQATIEAVQIMGGYGYMKDFPVERMMRDAKQLQIVEGTNQIQKIVISAAVLGKE